MVSLDRATQKELLDLLAPLLDRPEDRRGLLTLALGPNCTLLKQIDYNGAVEPFVLRMTERLANFGELEPGTTALWALLETIRERVGIDRQRRIDGLRPSLQTPLAEIPPQQPAPALPAQPLYLRVFLASPGDVASERSLALTVLEQLQYDPLLRGRVTVETVAWDKPGAGAPMLATLTPQAAIAQGLAKPSQCDIVIVVLWSRMGTLLPPEWKKPDGSPYLSGTEWEYLDALHAAEQQGRPDILVYRCGKKLLIDPDDDDAEEKTQQWKQVKGFFDGFSLPDGSISRGYNAYHTPEDFREQLNLHLRELVRRRLDVHTSAESATPAVAVSETDKPAPLWEGSPFPGLRAFSAADAPIFFGRGRETDELTRRLTEDDIRFMAVVGASGSGKSSLVAAGLLPRLQDNPISMNWIPVRFTPGGASGNPFRALAEALAEISSAHRADSLELTLCADLTELVSDILKDHPDNAQLLLFMDQFEELFTLVEESRRGPFISWLTTAARTERVRVIVTLRADFYAHCVAWQELAELLRAGSFPLAAPNLGALFEMIIGPAERAGLTFDEGLVAQILQDTGSEPGALALLAFALAELYAQRTDGKLTWDVYGRFGAVQGAIAQRADAIYRMVGANEQTLTAVFRELVEVDERGTATRRRAPRVQVTGSSDAKTLVDALTEGRLLVAGQDEMGAATVEVAHEALFRTWDTLTNWIEKTADDHRLWRQVRIEAGEWRRHRTVLWPHERLVLVYRMCTNLGIDPETLSPVERAFIRPESERLLKRIHNPATHHRERAKISDRLAEIGDLRAGVGCRKDGLPDIDWCAVPAGKVKLEEKAGTFDVKPFHIARYPLTYVQYRCFLEAKDGYRDPHWWDGLAEREDQPGEQYRDLDNHPAEHVSWYDAVAFCRWLSKELVQEIRERFGENHVIRLPTEWEWQQAATGGNAKHEYPWGSEWDSSYANTWESGLSRTTAVGMYPEGASSVGALDMAGNVEEWCLNEYEDPKRMGLSSDANRVVRGGSWDAIQDYARAAYRNWNYPDARGSALGIRVVCSSPIL